MPAPGDQYSGGDVKNPFEERVVSQFTAQEIATLQSRLNKQLGPEYISQRPGNGGGRVAYLEGNKAIALANEVFGFNGWSSSLGQVQIDYVDEHQNGKVSLGLSIVVRITLKDGTYHEDIGYGSIENGKGKAASFEKAKKEAATDGLKRSLRTFGNVLGNCLYDKEYLKKVQAMKVKPIRFEENNLYRHANFALPPSEGQSNIKRESHQTPIRPNQALRTRTEHLGESMSADFDDEFDGTLFDGVEITEHTDDAFTFEPSLATGSKAIEAARSSHGASEAPANLARQVPNGTNAQPNKSRQSTPVTHGPGGVPQQRSSNQGLARPPPNGPGGLNQRGPQTPVQPLNNPRPEQGRPAVPPTSNSHKTSAQQPHNGQQSSNGQPSKLTPPQAQQPSNQPPGLQPAGTTVPSANTLGTGNRPPVGFVTSRAAELLQNSDTSAPPSNIPAFNPHAESPLPKEQRTPGLDHTRSVPVKRQENGAGAAPPAQGAPRAAPATGGAGFGRPQETNRRIGMPGAPSYAMSPSANRGAYKPPTFANGAGPPNALKRERVALQDVSNANPNGNAAQGHETKRQRIETPDAENTRVGA